MFLSNNKLVFYAKENIFIQALFLSRQNIMKSLKIMGISE